MSKKTFYTIEHNNPLAIRAFKDTVAGLAISSTPDKNTNSHFESPSLFEDLQRALSKQNVNFFPSPASTPLGSNQSYYY